jgi:hypothetical protein
MEHGTWNMDLIIPSAKGGPCSISQPLLTVHVPYSFLTIFPYFYISYSEVEHQHYHTILSFFGGSSEKFAVPASVLKRKSN